MKTIAHPGLAKSGFEQLGHGILIGRPFSSLGMF